MKGNHESVLLAAMAFLIATIACSQTLTRWLSANSVEIWRRGSLILRSRGSLRGIFPVVVRRIFWANIPRTPGLQALQELTFERLFRCR